MMLVNALKLTEPGELPFSDVSDNDWYAHSVAIAYQSGIIKGKSTTVFDPETTITREEMVVITMKAYELLKGTVANAISDSPFKDATNISGWAVNDVMAAAGLKLISGRATGQFAPKAVSTRAEAAQLIYNLIK